MKEKIIDVLRNGSCAPILEKVANELDIPHDKAKELIATIEKEGIFKGYHAIPNYSKIDKGFCVIALMNLNPEEYTDPEKLALDLAKMDEVESLHLCSGEWDIVMSVRTKDQHEYFKFVKDLLKRKAVNKIKSQTSLKQIKNDYVYDC